MAILGLGFMGSTHAKALRSVRGAELVAVFSQDEKKLAGDLTAVRGNIGGPGEQMDFSRLTQHHDLRAVFADSKIDAVDICLPTDLHESVAIEAIRSGKDVLVEKPMSLDDFGVDAMLSAASRYGRIMMIAHVLRFMPAYIALRNVVWPGKYGLVRFAKFRRRCAAPAWGGWLMDAKKSGGGVFDLLIHDADIALHLFGKPESVTATGYTHEAGGIDYIEAQLYYAHGGVVSIEGGWHQPGNFPFSMEYTVVLDGATADYSSEGRPATLYPAGDPPQPMDGGSHDAYAAEIAYFVEASAMGRPPQLCPPRDSANAVKLMLLLLEARARSGRKILCKF